MRIAVVYNFATTTVSGRPEDIVADKDMELVPDLIVEELRALGHEVQKIEANWDLARACLAYRPRLAVNLTEGFAGTNAHEHLAPCILEFAGIPYTGADPINMLTLRDKLYTKDILHRYGFPMARHCLASTPDANIDDLNYPIILKPVREEASMGIYYDSVVERESDLRPMLERLIGLFRQPILVEEFIIGREISVGVWGNKRPSILPACEFLFRSDNPLRQFRSFEYKWQEGKETMVQVEDIDLDVLKMIENYALQAHIDLRCRDYSRADFRLAPDNSVYFLEHNFNPGIGPNSHGLNNTLPMMAEFAGVPYREFLANLIDIAIERYT